MANKNKSILDNIKDSNDIKKLSLEEKNTLAQELRDYIIDVVSNNGGHLASNLGVIELTIALHSVFDLNKDKIVWDVGHQSYAHKILTGRKESFKTLRQLNGIAGFPKTSENKKDCFNTGHSSTSISAAMGLATARNLKKEDYSVVSVIGDGALTGGMALEALNHVGSTNTKMIVILNDNEMSISKNVGGISILLSKLRTKNKYRKTNNYIRNITLRIPIIGKPIIKLVRFIKNGIKSVVIPNMFFEDLGFKYIGPVDGHNIKDLEIFLERAKDQDEPVLLHIITKKGKGYKPASDNPDLFHATSAFDIKTGLPKKEKKKDYSKAFGDHLVKLAKENKKIVAVTAAMKDGTGLKEFSNTFPNRFFDIGIAEEHAITFASGLAKEGLIPFVPIYSSFYQRAYDQVIHDVCMQELPVIMCVDRAGIVGNDGETHQGLFDLSFFNVVPNLTIMAPKDFQELESMMDFSISLNKPVVIRYPRGGEGNIAFTKHDKISLGKCEVLKKGNDITIIAIGNMTSRAMEVYEVLKDKKINIEVINVRFLKPIDKNTIINSIKKTKFVITIEDGTEIGGLGTTIKDLIVENKIKDIKFKSFAYPDSFVKHGSVSELESIYHMDSKSIIKYIEKEYR